MRVRILYFAAARERAGLSEEVVELPDGATVSHVLARVDIKLRPHLRVAVNREFAAIDHLLKDGDEIALIPPIAGGAGRLLALRDAPLDLAEAIRAVAAPDAGGIALFLGVVRAESHGRRVASLEYEAYREMVEATFARVADEAAARWPEARVAILHRVGTLAVGEIAVVVAAAAPHRAEAFAACRFAIDTLKQQAPIWKKEIGEDGAVWVGLDGCGPHDDAHPPRRPEE
ncbi:MAG: molybdenum cofactor biosynthesis protein MoaE [Myxococcota bacterium]